MKRHLLVPAALFLALPPSLPAAETLDFLEREIVGPTEKEIVLEEFGNLTTLTGDSLSVRITSRGDGKLLGRERFAAIHAALSTAVIADVARNINVELGDVPVVQKGPKTADPVAIAIDIRMDSKGVSYKAVTKSYETSNSLEWTQLFAPGAQ